MSREVLIYLGHVKSIGEEVLAKSLYDSDSKGSKDNGMPYWRSLDDVKKTCNRRSLKLNNAKVKCMRREQWKELVHDANGGKNV